MKGQKKNRKFIVLFLIVTASLILLSGRVFLNTLYTPAILMYHSVGEKANTLDGYDNKLNVDSRTFEKQMKFLKENNYSVIPLSEFTDMIKKRKRIPHRTVSITFDDGLKNNFLNAFPILKEYNLPATIFVATDFVGKDGFLDWEDIKTMQESGIAIESHTVSHRWLPSLSEKDIQKELFDSKEIIEKMTGRKVEILSYPLGGYDNRVKRIAMEAGYKAAVATNPGRKQKKNDPYALKRVRISMTSRNLLTFWIETSGYYTFIKEVRDED